MNPYRTVEPGAIHPAPRRFDMADAFFSGFRLYRWLRGGRWHCWFVEGIWGDVWLPEQPDRPIGGMGSPTVEDWS